MAFRGNYGSGKGGQPFYQQHPTDRRERGRNQPVPQMNYPPAYQAFYNNDNRGPPPPANFPTQMPPPQQQQAFARDGNPQISVNAGNSAPMQITLSFNPPTAEKPSYHDPAYPPHNVTAHNMPPPLVDKMTFHGQPPPYSPYPEPPPPAHLHGNMSHMHSSPGAQKFNAEHEGPDQGSQGRGKGSRMRGKFSQSCSNLDSSRQYNDPLSNPRGRDQFVSRGGHLISHSGHRGKGKLADEEDNKSDVSSFDGDYNEDGSYTKHVRGGNRYRRGQGRQQVNHHRGKNRNYHAKELDGANDDEDESDNSSLNLERSHERDESHKRGKGRQGNYNHRGKGFQGVRNRRNERKYSDTNFDTENLSDNDSDLSSERSFSKRNVDEGKTRDKKDRRNKAHFSKGNGKIEADGREQTKSSARDAESNKGYESRKDTDQGGLRRGNKQGEGQRRNQKQYENQGAKPKEDHKQVNNKLVVSLYFKKTFENASILRKLIQSETELHFPKWLLLDFSYDEIVLRHKEREAICKFTLSVRNVHTAKICVKKMVSALRENLKAFVKYDWPNDNGEDNNELTNESSENSTHATADKATRRERHRKRESTNNAGKDIEITSSQKTATIVSITVDKQFSSPPIFKEFLIKKASSLRFHLEFVDNSISLSNQSECKIQTESKANARKLTQLLYKLQKHEDFKIECATIQAGELASLKNDDDSSQLENTKSILMDKAFVKQNRIKDQFEKTKSTVTETMTELLKNHGKKIDKIDKELKKIKVAKSGKDADLDIQAMEDKLSEAKMQREEFLQYCLRLYEQFERLDSAKLKVDDINRFKYLFEIEFNRMRSILPIYAYREKIFQHVKSNQVSIIVGENGCGKSTQIPQYLFDAGYASEGTIVCTQPEQLATISIAEKVAKDRNVKVGTLVGLRNVTFSKANKSTKIIFATDHSLLNQCRNDPDLTRYSCIIIDEAHVHSMHSDLLLGMIKSCLSRRPDLKVIVLSTPIGADVFVKYFNTKHELHVSGRNFAVDVFYSEDSSEEFKEYEAKAVSKAIEVHANFGEGDILVFLSSPVDTLLCCQEFEKRCHGKNDFKCMPLHDQLPHEEIKKVFAKIPIGKRKIIFANKFAETSCAIDGIKYVIDTGMTSEIKYDSEQKMNVTKTCPLDQRSANVRANCAAYSVGGQCFRLYSLKTFDVLALTLVPEIIRVHHEKALLKLMELGISLDSYNFVQTPSEMSLDIAMETLTQYGAVAAGQITEVGILISKLPFDLKLGFLISEANKFNMIYDAVVLASIITNGSDFSYRNFFEITDEVDERNKRNFGCETMDSFAWLKVYKTWIGEPKDNRAHWCRCMSVNYKLINSVYHGIEGVMHILSKHLDTQLEHIFSDSSEALTTLKKLFLKSKHPRFSTL